MRSISLYVHVPFCRRRCPYCTFYHVHAKDEAGTARFVDAVVREFEGAVEDIGGPFSIPSMYFGGGTPSLLGGRAIGRVIEAARLFLDTTAEITVEANPEDVNDAMLSGLAEAGVNRLSLGIQSLSPRAQKILNRCDPQTNKTAMNLAN